MHVGRIEGPLNTPDSCPSFLKSDMLSKPEPAKPSSGPPPSLDPLDLPAFSERFASRVLRSETTLTTDEVFAALDTDGDRTVDGEELPGFRELVPEPRWSEEDFLQRFGHHLHHSTHAQARCARGSARSLKRQRWRCAMDELMMMIITIVTFMKG